VLCGADGGERSRECHSGYDRQAPVAGHDAVSRTLKISAHAIHAVSLARRRRTIIEDVANVATRSAAMHLDPSGEQAAISIDVPIASGNGAVKLGHPVPLSNLS
jgi:hypothetical protein